MILTKSHITKLKLGVWDYMHLKAIFTNEVNCRGLLSTSCAFQKDTQLILRAALDIDFERRVNCKFVMFLIESHITKNCYSIYE